MYSLAPEKTLRLVYETFYLAIQVTFYETVGIRLLKGAEQKNGNSKCGNF